MTRPVHVATFVWTPSTRELRSCGALPSLLDLDAEDERPLLNRILDRLDSDDVDRLHGSVRDLRAGSDPEPVELELTLRSGSVRHLTATATRAPADEAESVMGVVQDVTRFRHVERALEVRHAVTSALANWEALGFDGLLGPLGSALSAREVTVWASRDDRLRPLATWQPEDDPVVDPSGQASDVVLRAWQLRLPVADAADGGAHLAVGTAPGVRTELAFPVVTLTDVLAVIECRSPTGLWVSDTLTRLLSAVGREVGVFFATKHCPPDIPDLSPRERQVLELVAEGLSAPEIAARLVLSPSTVRSHIRNVHAKLQVSDRVSAVVKAMRGGLLS